MARQGLSRRDRRPPSTSSRRRPTSSTLALPSWVRQRSGFRAAERVAQAGRPDQRPGGGPHGAHARWRPRGSRIPPVGTSCRAQTSGAQAAIRRAIRLGQLAVQVHVGAVLHGTPQEGGGPRRPQPAQPVASVEEVPGEDAQRDFRHRAERHPLCPASQASTIPRRAPPPPPHHRARPLVRGLLDGGRPGLRRGRRVLPAVLPAGVLGVRCRSSSGSPGWRGACSAARPPTPGPGP